MFGSVDGVRSDGRRPFPTPPIRTHWTHSTPVGVGVVVVGVGGGRRLRLVEGEGCGWGREEAVGGVLGLGEGGIGGILRYSPVFRMQSFVLSTSMG